MASAAARSTTTSTVPVKVPPPLEVAVKSIYAVPIKFLLGTKATWFRLLAEMEVLLELIRVPLLVVER